MILASHNSWSYAKPKYWYMYPFRFMAKCQSKNIREQWNSGVRMYDLRVFFDETGNLLIRHGLMSFNISPQELYKNLEFLNEKANMGYTVIIRVILEQNHKNKKQKLMEYYFRNFCISIEGLYTHVFFIEGVRKFDWQTIYSFNMPVTPVIEHKYSSTTAMFGGGNSKWYAKFDDFWPWLYAFIHNDYNFAKYIDNSCYLMLDFI